MDPDDNVLIIDPKSKVKFLVSSKVLVLAAPVFCAMCSPNYSEGVALASGTQWVEIHLPEDSTDAMDIVFNILHFQNHNVDIYLGGYGGVGAERISMNLPHRWGRFLVRSQSQC